MTGLCVVCPVLRPSEKPRIPTWPTVCDGCRTWLRTELTALPGSVAALSVERGAGQHEHVSGTPERTIPPREDVIDLQLRANPGSVGPWTRGYLGLDEDQVGSLSVATQLLRQVDDWMTYLPAEHLPDATITAMTSWLLLWLDWACDEHPGIDEFATDLRDVVRDVRAAANAGAARGEKVGRCPAVLRDEDRCGTQLRADPYMDRIACPRCGTTWDRRQQGWVHLRAAQLQVTAEKTAEQVA